MVGKCKHIGCEGKIPFDGKHYCEKHMCTRCSGTGKVEPSYMIFVTCHMCNGSGKKFPGRRV